MRCSALIRKANIITKITKGNYENKKRKKKRTSVYVEWLLLPKRPVLTELLEMEDI